MRRQWLAPLAMAGAALAVRQVARRREPLDLRGKVVLITGGSRGLGYAMAHAFGHHGAKVAICARDPQPLEQAREALQRAGMEVFAEPCDVSDRAQVERWIEHAVDRLGPVDVLVNNAGVIMVGPLETQTLDDFQQAMDIMYWGVVYPTLAVLPAMRARRLGHIATITSIGGKVSVPHLLSYSSAKFAAVGFSEGLRNEMAKDGITVTTVVPGLMRTGSHLNALFKGKHQTEFALFSPLASLPMTSLDGETAARQVVEAVRRGEPEVFLGWQAGLAARLYGLWPGVAGQLLGLVNRALPAGGGIGTDRATGHASRSAASETPLTTLGEQAAERFNQYGDAAER